MTASFSFVVVDSDHSEKRWVMTCNGLLTFPLHICTGPLGVTTATGSPIFRTRVDLFAGADNAGWGRDTLDGDVEGTTDYCPISYLLLGLAP